MLQTREAVSESMFAFRQHHEMAQFPSWRVKGKDETCWCSLGNVRINLKIPLKETRRDGVLRVIPILIPCLSHQQENQPHQCCRAKTRHVDAGVEAHVVRRQGCF